MTIYAAYLPPDGTSDKFRLVPDEKSVLALLFPPFWLIWHRLWLELLVYIAAAGAISWFASSQPGPAVFYLSALPGLFLLLEGRELICRKLERQGWQFAGVVEAGSRDEAELRFVLKQKGMVDDEVETVQQVVAKPSAKPLNPPKPTTQVGLFPE